jgi:hypothetical protein
MNENKTIILSINDELDLIENTIYNLVNEINRYKHEIKNLWDNHIIKFICSGDCLILDYIGINGYDKFYNLMTNQKTFKLMKISLKRLQQRKLFIIKNR